MKSKITNTGSLNEIKMDFVPDITLNSGPEISTTTSNQLTFTDLYLKDSQGDKRPVSKIKYRAPGIETFKNINFRIAVLSFKGFFKDFMLRITYRGENNSTVERSYPIASTLLVAINLPLDDIIDLTQVGMSICTKNGSALKITLNPDGMEPLEKIELDFTAVSHLNLFVNNDLQDKTEADLPLGWISYNTPNILY